MRLLNVGGGPTRTVPDKYADYTQDLLDVDPDVKPDIVCDARELQTLPANTYDVVYCSHTLEHFYKHDIARVLAGFMHVLKPGGLAQVNVPNVWKLFEAMQKNNLDLDDVWYRSGPIPITFHDVLYGWHIPMANGNLHYAHKSGFTSLSIGRVMSEAGFDPVMIGEDDRNLYATGTKKE